MNSRRDLSRVRLKVQACLLLVRRFYLGPGIFMVWLYRGFLGLGELDGVLLVWVRERPFPFGETALFFFSYTSPRSTFPPFFEICVLKWLTTGAGY